MKRYFPILVLAVLLASCEKEFPKKVRYVVTCTSCDLTYSNSQESTEQRSMTSTWNYEFAGDEGQFLYISAQNNNSSGTVKVRIDVDGKTFKSGSSTGAYVIATATGSLE